MKTKRNIVIAISLLGFLSCSSVEKTGNNVVKQNEKIDIIYDRAKETESKLTEERIAGLRDKAKGANLVDILTADNFTIKGLDYLYEGEEIVLNKDITYGVRIEKISYKNPSIEIDDKDERYAKYSENVDGKIKVENLADNKKRITFLDKNAVYITLVDTYDGGEKRELKLNQLVEIKKIEEAKDGIRYEELKKGHDNNRIEYEVVTYEGGYEDKAPERITIDEEDGSEIVTQIPFDKYYKEDKYEDLDDLAGIKEVSVKSSSANKEEISKIKVDFGIKLKDYEGKYEELLTDLDKTTLKFSEDGSSITGGFNPDLVAKLQKYEKAVSGKENTLEFITELADGNTKNVGNHKIVRKILRDGVVIYQKEEIAHVGFPGTTIAIADSSFYEAYPELEERIYRYTVKGLDKTNDDTKDPQQLDREHGSTVIGSAIDEIAIGNANDVNSLVNSILVKRVILMGLTRDLSALGPTANDDLAIRRLITFLERFYSSVPYSTNELFNKKFDVLLEKVKNYSKVKEKVSAETEQEKKEEIYKEYYKELFNIYEEVAAIPELDKLKATDLHFKVIALDDGSGLKSSPVKKHLPRLLEEDKNVKVLNMSYGTDASISELDAIKNMTDEEIDKAVLEYNENVVFRTTVRAWLHRMDYEHLDLYKTEYPGELSIPSMMKYFDSKEKITRNDYKKLLDLKRLFIENRLKDKTELLVSNSDILFVVAHGNSRNNSGQTDVDLVNFDKNGDKIIFLDNNGKYDNPFMALPIYLNQKLKEEAQRTNSEYKYDYLYRKNLLSVIGLSSKELRTGGNATEDISDEWGLYTTDGTVYNRAMLYVKNMIDSYEDLRNKLSKIEEDESKYSKEYIGELKAQINAIEQLSKLDKDPNGKSLLISFTRAGKSKIWAVAAEGMYSYNKKLSEEEKKYNEIGEIDPTDYMYTDSVGINRFASGSSFAAPRITAIAGEVGTKYPWMSAQQIKQTILTTATDDFRVKKETVDNVEKEKFVGIYGVDENIGWGISNKDKAYLGPARFVKALTRETGVDDFVADIPYGIYHFRNDIEGGFSPILHMATRNKLTTNEFRALIIAETYSPEVVLTEEFATNEKTKPIADLLTSLGYENVEGRARIYLEYKAKVDSYINSLDIEERELFEDAGLVKKGKGMLILSGDNKYKDPTVVEEGTLVFRGSSKSPFVVHKGAKLKLDMKYSEEDLTKAEDYEAKIDASVINGGELYSYSSSDRILDTYTPLKDAKTYIAAIAKLDIAKLDLSEVDRFRFDVFRKKGMNIFSKPENYSEGITKEEMNEVLNNNPDEKEILKVDLLAKSDLHKVKLGKRNISAFVDLIVETKDIDGDKDNVSLIAKLVRKNKIEPETQGLLGKVREELAEKIFNSSGEEKVKLENQLEDTDWIDKTDAKKLNGDVLVNSEIIDYEIVDLKNNIISNNLDNDKIKGLELYVKGLTNFKLLLDREKGDKSISINGLTLGSLYNQENSKFGISLNLTNSVLRDYTLKLEEDERPIRNDLSEEERKEAEAKKEIKELQGNVYADNFGVSAYGKFNIGSVELKGIFGGEYVAKRTEREIEDRKVVKVDSTDILLTSRLEAGYNFKLTENTKLTPTIGLNTYTQLRGGFSEDTEFGFISDSEWRNKLSLSLGLKGEYLIDSNSNLRAGIRYDKYITSPLLEKSVKLKNYEFKHNIQGISLEDNSINYYLEYRHRLDKLEISLGYNAKNIKHQGLNLGLNYQF